VTTAAECQWIDTVRSLNTWKRGNTRAVHKPLFTLLLLARAQGGKDSSVSYAEIRDVLTKLLIEFGPPRRSHHPENPFWYLQTDGIWVVENADMIPRKKDGRSISSSALINSDARGHVPDNLWNELQQNPSLIGILSETILTEYWPDSLHQSIKAAIGLSPDSATQPARRPRDPAFREAVLRAYERRCAICGYDGRLGNVPLGIEAAHIQWHAYAGPDVIDNGLALCTFHHLALDKGAIGISKAGEILVSTDLTGNEATEYMLFRFAGLPLRRPQSAYPFLQSVYIDWHRREVFKGPARNTTSRILAAAEAREEYRVK